MTKTIATLSNRNRKALANAAVELIDDPRSARELAIEFGLDEAEVKELQARIRAL